MEAIKQILKVSKDHKITATVPPYIRENEIVEMILIVKKGLMVSIRKLGN